jgi:exodeoxyribonuclease VII small subunit
MEKENKIKLEDELKKLENIVKELESGDTDLDDAINKYTEAMKIAKDCSDKLTKAEEQVNKILTENGKLEDFNVE